MSSYINNKLECLVVFFSIAVSSLALEFHLFNWYMELSFAGFFLLMFYAFTRNSQIKLIRIEIDIYWLLLFCFSFSGMFFSVFNIDYIYFLKFILVTLVFYVCFILYHTKKDKLLFYVFLSFSASCALISILLEIFKGSFMYWDFTFARNASIFFDPNYASAIFSTSIMLTFILINKFILKLMLGLLYLVAIIFTYSKAGVLAFVFGFCGYLYYRYSYKSIVYLVLFIILLVLCFKFIDVDISMFRVEQGANFRDEYFYLVIDYVYNQNNFFGGGYETIGKLIKNAGYANSSTHNYYLDLLIANSVLTFIFLIPIISVVIVLGIKKRSMYFPVFITLFILSNTISISIGGIGILSFIFSYSIIDILYGDSYDSKRV
ncbi:putative membrane protein [Glaesserella parasuis]|nr:putative membrane protein [Glaesserella parasuis]EQA04544.1 putative membrane protein [Glaesserella parasuis MN-H]